VLKVPKSDNRLPKLVKVLMKLSEIVVSQSLVIVYFYRAASALFVAR